jgi:hypothetical protein
MPSGCLVHNSINNVFVCIGDMSDGEEEPAEEEARQPKQKGEQTDVNIACM